MESLTELADRVSRGNPIDDDAARVILDSRDLIAVGVIADDVRRRFHGARTTFVRVFEIHVDAPPAVLPPRVSAGEFRIIGCPASHEAAVHAVRAAAALIRRPGVAPAVDTAALGAAGDREPPLTGFTLADLQAIGGTSFADVCSALREAGLEAISEVAIDRLEDGGLEAIAAARMAGLAVTRLTVHALSAEARISAVSRARDLQAAAGGFRVFAPLPRTGSISVPSTGYDDVKQVALARLVAIDIRSIQVDWALYGPKLAQFALTIGADDVDGVAAIDPGVLGTRRSPIEEIRGNIRSASLEPVERNARYEAMI